MRLRFSPNFKKRVKKLPLSAKRKLSARLILFVEDPYNPLLHNHTLIGQWGGYRSINITGDYRAIYEKQAEDLAYFIDVGTHAFLYK